MFVCGFENGTTFLTVRYDNTVNMSSHKNPLACVPAAGSRSPMLPYSAFTNKYGIYSNINFIYRLKIIDEQGTKIDILDEIAHLV